jgi:hypothetical protein
MRPKEALSLQSRVPVRSTKLFYCYPSQPLRVGYHQFSLQCRHLHTSASPSRTCALRILRGHRRVCDGSNDLFNVACPSGTLTIDPSRGRLPARFSSDRTSLSGLTAHCRLLCTIRYTFVALDMSQNGTRARCCGRAHWRVPDFCWASPEEPR